LNHWLSTIPGVVIVLLVLGLNVLGDGLRDVFDPRLKGLG
jgi:ABC-type dipeptide/oligopeptide/nickel transport system permease subunit